MADSGTGKCQVCSKDTTARCSWCRAVFYCSTDHQKKDWKAHKAICSQKKYEIFQDEKKGRCLVANDVIKPDQIILKDKPIVVGPKYGTSTNAPESSNNLYCFGCYKEIIEPEDDEGPDPGCVDCGLPMCSPECSNEYFHKQLECKFFSECRNSLESKKNEDQADTSHQRTQSELYNIVSVIQSLLYFRCLLLRFLNPKGYSELMKLESNNEYREDLGSLEKTTRLFDDFKKIFSNSKHPTITEIEKPDLHKIIGIVGTNGVDIKISPSFELVGIFPLFSMLEHNCIPNVKFYITPSVKSSFELYCRSASKITPGTHLCVTYTNLLWNTEKRREDLKRNRYFLCECSRCTDPFELGSNFSTLLCPECKSYSVPIPKNKGVAIVGIDDQLPTYVWKCQNGECQKNLESWQVKNIDIKLGEMVSKMKTTIGSCKTILEVTEELVHPDYYLNYTVNHSLIQMLAMDSVTRNQKEALDEKIQICNRLLNLNKILDPGLAQLNVYTGIIYYEMQSAILAMAGGETDDDFNILRQNPESVKLAKVYLQKCIDCFQYEVLDLPENRLKVLGKKKIEYMNMILKLGKKKQ